MCLLDEVTSFDASNIICRATSHRRLDNPLRSADGLGIACGVEYAAQAMAIHGAAGAGSTDQKSPRGFLAGVRDVKMHAQRLDDIEDDLICEATLTAGDAGTALYQFSIRAGARTLLTGRATVVFDAMKHAGMHEP